MGGIDGGIVGAGALIGTVAMKITLLEEGDMGGDMMSMTTIIAGAGGTGAQVLATGEGEVGAHEEGGMPVQLGKVVRRGVPKLNSGTGKGNSKKMLKWPALTVTAKAILKMLLISM